MMRRSLALIVIFLAFLPLTASSGRTQDPKPAGGGAAAADAVVLKVLGEEVTEKQVLDTIDQIAKSQQVSPDLLQQKEISLYRDALDSLVGGILLRNEAKEKNIVPTAAKVDEAFGAIKKQFPDETQFQKALKDQGITEGDIRKSITNNLVYQEVLDQALKDLPVPTDAEVQKFYDDNPSYFEEPEQVHAAHIFLKVDAGATAEQKAATRKKLEGLRADVESKKTTFAEAAKSSDDTSTAQSGGDLGFFARGQMLPVIEEAAFAVKPGSLTPVVESQYGFHLIEVLELKPAGKTPLTAAKPDITAFLERKGKQDATKQHIDGLRAKVTVETVMSDEEWNSRHAKK